MAFKKPTRFKISNVKKKSYQKTLIEKESIKTPPFNEIVGSWMMYNDGEIGDYTSEGNSFEHLLDKTEKKYDNLIKKFNDFSDPFKVYRAIDVKDFDEFHDQLKKGKFLEKYKGLGVYWSWNKDEVESYWSEGGDTVILTALVHKTNVDWKDTLIKNLDMVTGHESEININPGSPINLITIMEEDKIKQEIPVNLRLIT